MTKSVSGVLSSDPRRARPAVGVLSTGKFWNPLGPTSPSPMSLGVTPSGGKASLRSIPSVPLSWMVLRLMTASAPWTTSTPKSPLPEMVFPAPASEPPTRTPTTCWTATPPAPLGTVPVPTASVPIRLPSTVMPSVRAYSP